MNYLLENLRKSKGWILTIAFFLALTGAFATPAFKMWLVHPVLAQVSAVYRADQIFMQGLEQLNNGQFKEAKKSFEQALEIYLNH